MGLVGTKEQQIALQQRTQGWYENHSGLGKLQREHSVSCVRMGGSIHVMSGRYGVVGVMMQTHRGDTVVCVPTKEGYEFIPVKRWMNQMNFQTIAKKINHLQMKW